LCKLLVLPANVRLVWKVITRYKHSSLFDLSVVYIKNVLQPRFQNDDVTTTTKPSRAVVNIPRRTSTVDDAGRDDVGSNETDNDDKGDEDDLFQVPTR
jgi:hypothetical protein